MAPEDRKYTKSHEWVRTEDGLARVGITDHAQQALGDVTFVELPEPGTSVSAGDECGEIESVKAAGELYAPVSGTVGEVNQALEDAPEKLNESPFEEGWIFTLTDFDAGSAELMNAGEYAAYVESL
ncbi:glycine cleavage system protein GcvH [Kiritimatiella glycovorans]|uniref:Glycine cleavage system H protein n=1 Tax=Kiritimatiella glycovorans TaxID=1307763 RepID=A0A0G3EII6_9BACT|nr:glycine cleavage system protein GcvH [Kiritimatiella glycovorans]AKJ65252.1 Glycine cleavage system H protein [Kiritimatiella glycovorans]